MLLNKARCHKGVALFLVSCGFIAEACGFAGGTGEPNDPYEIATAEQFISVGSDPNLLDKHFMLINDINLDPNLPGGEVFTRAVVAPDTESAGGFQGVPFTGCFDGCGHTIRHLTIQGGSGQHLGLFGRIGRGGQVYRLGLEQAEIAAPNDSSCVGGLAGESWGSIACCHANVSIFAGANSRRVGGLVGWNSWGYLVNCLAVGHISLTDGADSVGGAVGGNGGSIYYPEYQDTIGTSGSITHCFSAASISAGHASTRLGGLLGTNESGAIRHSFWDVQGSGLPESAGGVGLTIAETHNPEVFSAEGWDLVGERENGTADLWLVPAPDGYPALASFSGSYEPRRLTGSGTAQDPYLITTAGDFGAMWDLSWSAHYRLTDDIDLSGITWTTSPIWHFEGTLEGTGFVMSGFTIRSDGDYLGLFRTLGCNALVTDLSIEGVRILGEGDVGVIGSLAGQNDGTVRYCHCTGSVSGAQVVGGLVGVNMGLLVGCSVGCSVISEAVAQYTAIGGLVGQNIGRITNSDASGEVAGAYVAGGLAGSNDGTISGCFATGNVTGEDNLGGLVGDNGRGTITACYATGNCHSRRDPSVYTAGLVGWNERGTIANCYATGRITLDIPEPWHRGGLVGRNFICGSVINCFWDTQASGASFGDGGVGLTTAQMMDSQVYSLNGWANDPNWILDSGRDYPRLAWEGTPGEPIPAPTIDWFDGSGTPEDPYLVATAEQLARIGNASVLWDKAFSLVCDIDLTGVDMSRIGICLGTDFTGIFSGDGHMISNLILDMGDVAVVSHVGLFGFIGSEGYVHELGVLNATIQCGWYAGNVGILAGTNEGTISDCLTGGSVSVGDHSECIGALAGLNRGSITECDSTATVSAGEHSRYVGGLVGYGGEQD